MSLESDRRHTAQQMGTLKKARNDNTSSSGSEAVVGEMLMDQIVEIGM